MYVLKYVSPIYVLKGDGAINHIKYSRKIALLGFFKKYGAYM